MDRNEWDLSKRTRRKNGPSSASKTNGRENRDRRDDYEKDHDRILYLPEFRRLSRVSQVVSAGHGGFFHNRLTHTLKVAQLGRRLAERTLDGSETSQTELARDVYGISPDVVEAACLAHDLGHPPFGHIAEYELNTLVENDKDEPSDGYEGNAQSFRIVTRLAVQKDSHFGVDLTRATMCALLKYPWARDDSDPIKSRKWGFYQSEAKLAEYYQEWLPQSQRDFKTPEAEIMDWADDITYSVHDIEDFHRANCIPWHLFDLATNEDPNTEYRDQLINNAIDDWHSAPSEAKPRLEEAMGRVIGILQRRVHRPIYTEPYEGTRLQRVALSRLVSTLVERYLSGFKLVDCGTDGGPTCDINPDYQDEVRILKQITRRFMHENTALGAQQAGYRKIVRALYEEFRLDIGASGSKSQMKVVPKRFQETVAAGKERREPLSRLVADVVSSLGEDEAVGLFKRLAGLDEGSVRDPIVV